MTDSEKRALITLYITQEPYINMELDATLLPKLLLNISTEDIFLLIQEYKGKLVQIDSNNIPQFSNDNAINQVLRVVIDSDIKELSYEKIGYYLCSKEANQGARIKYGENHYKLAAQLGLVTYNKPYNATDLGLVFYLSESSAQRQELVKRLAMRIPIIQQALLLGDNKTVDMSELICQYLAKSTMLRRRLNIRLLLNYVRDISDKKMQHRLNNIIWG